jgi:hypothetical protein
MTASIAPEIYVRLGTHADRVDVLGRCVAAIIGTACLGVLLVAAWLPPSPSGVGTHTALRLQSCPFLVTTGLPCPGCGMTTSFAWFARANVLASLYVQPMGFVLATLCAVGFWGSLYVCCSGKPIYRLAQRIPTRYYLYYLPGLAIAAWAWKIWIHVHHLDGWQ